MTIINFSMTISYKLAMVSYLLVMRLHILSWETLNIHKIYSFKQKFKLMFSLQL